MNILRIPILLQVNVVRPGTQDYYLTAVIKAGDIKERCVAFITPNHRSNTTTSQPLTNSRYEVNFHIGGVFASNENMFIVFLDDWVERGRVQVFSTFTKDASGVEKRPFDLTLQYVLIASDPDVTKFTIRDLDNKLFYWFDGSRGTDTITLNLHNIPDGVVAQIELTKLTK